MWYNLNTCYMAHGVQYMPLPAPCIKLWSGNQSHNQSLIMLLTLVTCRRRASASSFQALVYRASLPAKNISAGLVVALLQEKTELGDASEVHARCGFLLEMGWGNTALWQDLFGNNFQKFRGASICFAALLLQGLVVVEQQMLAPPTLLIYRSWLPFCFSLPRSLSTVVFLLFFCLLGQPSDL